MSEREKFEKWARVEEFEVFHDGAEYVDHITNCAWLGWQAALSTRKPYGSILLDKVGNPWASKIYIDGKRNLIELEKESNERYPTRSPFKAVTLFYEEQS